MQQHAANHHGHVGVAAELLGGRVCQQNGQEVEGCVRHEIDDLVSGSSGVHPLEGHQQGQHRLEHTGSRNGRQHRGENAGDGIDEPCTDTLLLLGAFLCPFILTQVAHLSNGLEYMVHIVADNHLILSAADGYPQNPGGLFQSVSLGFAFVFQVEPKTGGTMGQSGDVFFSAHQGQDFCAEFLIIHLFSSFDFFSFSKKSTATIFCIKASLGRRKSPSQKNGGFHTEL